MTKRAPARGRPSATDPRLDLVAAARLPVGDVLNRLATSAAGLNQQEADRRLLEVGPNVLASHQVTLFGVLLRQLHNPLLILLMAAAGVSALTGDVTDGSIIAAIVVLSVGLGFVNEYRSEVAVAALHDSIRHDVSVWRDGAPRRVDVRQLVPGDVVALQVGDVVAADVRLIDATQLECDEGVLTGESMPSAKDVTAPPPADSTVDLPSCAFMGTVVRQGSAQAVVVATGSDTAFGKIAEGLNERQADTAFQVGLRGFSKLLVRVAAVLTGSIFVINVALHRPLIDALLFSLAIAIGITPQLLPAIVSVSLSAGSRALARKRVLVKRLVVIEDLGNIEILFTDKTGTLTEGSITFDAALDPDGRPAPDALLLGRVCCIREGRGRRHPDGMRRQRVPTPRIDRSAFAGYRFPPEVIILAVRWYLWYGLSYRDIEELLAERGVMVDHVSVYRWVQTFTPLLVDAARCRRHGGGDRWFVDETYVRVSGRWMYLHRAVDQYGQVIDVVLADKRDLAAARRFFQEALSASTSPVEVTTDLAGVYPAVLDELLPAARHITDQYANNRIEADHSRLKARLRSMRGLKRVRSTRIIAAGHALVQNIRRGHYGLAGDSDHRNRLAVAFDELIIAI